jgi:hypothetical protein
MRFVICAVVKVGVALTLQVPAVTSARPVDPLVSMPVPPTAGRIYPPGPHVAATMSPVPVTVVGVQSSVEAFQAKTWPVVGAALLTSLMSLRLKNTGLKLWAVRMETSPTIRRNASSALFSFFILSSLKS